MIFQWQIILFLQPKTQQRPPSPPRQLKEIYISAEEFRTYLKELDSENENVTLQTFLNFVLKCNELRNSSSNKKDILAVLSSDFINCPNRSKRVALKNEFTREELKKYLAKPDVNHIPQHLWNAEEEVLGQLDEHYQNFTKNRHLRKKNENLTACLLWWANTYLKKNIQSLLLIYNILSASI